MTETKAVIWMLIIMAIGAVIGIMLSSVYRFNSVPDNKVAYNEFVFERTYDGFWKFAWQDAGEIYSIPMRYNPTQLGNVTIRGSFSPGFGQRPVYMTVDPQENASYQYVGLAMAELGLGLKKVLQVELLPACTRNVTACQNTTIVRCGDPEKSVIVIREGPGPIVDIQGDCVIIQGDRFGMLQAVDRLLYKLYRVMKE